MDKKQNTFPLLQYADSKNANMRYYLQAFNVSDPVILVHLSETKRILFANSLEIDRARCETADLEVVLLEDPRKQLLEIMDTKVIYVDKTLPISFCKFLEKQGFSIHISEYIESLRLIKLPFEIDNIRKASKLTIATFKQLQVDIMEQKLISPKDIRHLLNRKLYEKELIAESTIIAGGLEASEPHNIGYMDLDHNKPVVFDIFPKDMESGYYTDISRTIFLAEPTDNYREYIEVVRRAQELAIKAVKPGIKFIDLEKMVREYFDKLKFQTKQGDNGKQNGFFHSLGHGVGLEVHEAPFCNDTILKENMIITIEPGLYYTDPKLNPLGVVGGVRIEDMLLVTSNGAEVLSKI